MERKFWRKVEGKSGFIGSMAVWFVIGLGSLWVTTAYIMRCLAGCDQKYWGWWAPALRLVVLT